MVTVSTGAITYYHTDHQGSTVALSNSSGAVTDGPFTYSAYGEIGQEGPTGNPYRYAGRYFDAETGLYYYRARYYSPTLGRFLQTDPIGIEDQINLYAYVGNDPVNGVDPSGKTALAACIGGPIACAVGATIQLVTVIACAFFCEDVIEESMDAVRNAVTISEAHAPRALTDDEKQDLSDRGREKDPADKSGKLTKAGRALEKHGNRKGSVFPKPTGSADDKNAQGQEELDKILQDPDSTIEVDEDGVTTVTAPDGRGVRYNEDGSFRGFREPEDKLDEEY